jgi:hypothetical protein
MTALRLPAPAADSLRGILAAIVLEQLGRPGVPGAAPSTILIERRPSPIRLQTKAGGKITIAGRARKSPL